MDTLKTNFEKFLNLHKGTKLEYHDGRSVFGAYLNESIPEFENKRWAQFIIVCNLKRPREPFGKVWIFSPSRCPESPSSFTKLEDCFINPFSPSQSEIDNYLKTTGSEYPLNPQGELTEKYKNIVKNYQLERQ